MVAQRRCENLQARWRDETLRLPPGPPTHPTSRRYTVPYCLPRDVEGVTAAEGGWNLLSDQAHDYARRRSAGFRVFDDRLWRNMLSSQPLAFSIAGELRAHPGAATATFSRLTGLPLEHLEVLPGPDELDGLHAEWAPPPTEHTGDGSGFDIAAAFRTTEGRRILLTVEVKYTDDFSSGVSEKDLPRRLAQYSVHLDALGIDPTQRARLLRGRTSQFLRSVMITDSVVRRGPTGHGGLDAGVAVVLALGADVRAKEVVEEVTAAMQTRRVQAAFWSLEDFVAACSAQRLLASWAERLSRRYLTG